MGNWQLIDGKVVLLILSVYSGGLQFPVSGHKYSDERYEQPPSVYWPDYWRPGDGRLITRLHCSINGATRPQESRSSPQAHCPGIKHNEAWSHHKYEGAQDEHGYVHSDY